MKKHIAPKSSSDKIPAMPKKNIDEKIDDLAIIVGKGFERVDKRFNEIHNEMDRRFDIVDKRFDAVEKHLDRVEFFVSGYDRRLDNVEDKVKQLAVKVGLRFN